MEGRVPKPSPAARPNRFFPHGGGAQTGLFSALRELVDEGVGLLVAPGPRDVEMDDVGNGARVKGGTSVGDVLASREQMLKKAQTARSRRDAGAAGPPSPPSREDSDGGEDLNAPALPEGVSRAAAVPAAPVPPAVARGSVHVLGRTVGRSRLAEVTGQLTWCTYRSNFPPLAPPHGGTLGYITDSGWGCMLRSAQMLLAHALRVHVLGWTPSPRPAPYGPPAAVANPNAIFSGQDVSAAIATLFSDVPIAECPLGLHAMVVTGQRYDKLPGEWYGPGTACYVLRDLVALFYGKLVDKRPPARRRRKKEDSPVVSIRDVDAAPEYDDITDLCVFVATEGCLYRDAVEAAMVAPRPSESYDGSEEDKKEDNWDDDESSEEDSVVVHDPLLCPPVLVGREGDQPWRSSLLLLVPLRLGLKKFDVKRYGPSLTKIFSYRQSLGCLGGHPRHALWFVGCDADGGALHGLDPHTVQQAPNLVRKGVDAQGDDRWEVEVTAEYLRTFRCARGASECPLERIDPSLSLAFYCRDREEFDSLFAALRRDFFEEETALAPPFTVGEKGPDYGADLSGMADMMSGVGRSSEGGGSAVDEDEDDFVVL